MKQICIGRFAGTNLKSALRNFKSAITLCVVLFAFCLSAEAQQPAKIPRIGFLTLLAGPTRLEESFVQGLRELGYVEGRNITIEYRWAGGKADRLHAFAAELVRLKVDLIVARAMPAVQAAKNATTTIPIVMLGVADAVGSGFVASLAHPGGNLTGTTNIMPELAGKRLELLSEIVPKLTQVSFLAHGGDPAHELFVKQAEDAAKEFRLRFQPLVIESPDEIERSFTAMKKERSQALIVQPLFISSLGQGKKIAGLAVKHRLPTVSDGNGFVEEGGLIFYGPDLFPTFRRAAILVDKILKGSKPADLPVEQPKKFEFIVNLKAAKQIGLTIPPNVLARADRVVR